MTAGPPTAPRLRHGPGEAVVLLGALLVVGGVAWLLDLAGVRVPWRAVLPAALIAVGLAAAAGAFRGRQTGTVLVGVALVVVLTAAAATDWSVEVPLSGGFGDRTERPAAVAELGTYRLAVGHLTVDLSGLVVPPGTTTVHARVGVGQIQVEPPDGIALQVVGRSGLGQVQALGREESGVGSRLDARSDLFDGAARRLVLDLRVGIGQVQVSS